MPTLDEYIAALGRLRAEVGGSTDVMADIIAGPMLSVMPAPMPKVEVLKVKAKREQYAKVYRGFFDGELPSSTKIVKI